MLETILNCLYIPSVENITKSLSYEKANTAKKKCLYVQCNVPYVKCCHLWLYMGHSNEQLHQ